MDQEAWQTLLTFLFARHSEIKAQEDAAKNDLAKGDTEGYSRHLHERARMVSLLAGEAAPLTKGLPENLVREVLETLRRFSASASFGLKIDSLFYLSALLYRDDHGVDEPDNLVTALKKMKDQGEDYVRL